MPKRNFFGGKLRATTAYFNITKTNVPINDLAHPGYVLIAGEVNAKGLEFDLQGEIMPGWNATLAYSHIDTVTLKSDNKIVEGEPLAGGPRNQASFFTTYEIKHGDLKGLKFGGGASYQDLARYANISGQKLGLSTPAFATIDFMGGYEWQFAGQKLNAQLNITNLLDTKYYVGGQVSAPPGTDTGGFCAGISCSRLGAYGIPRNIVGSLSASF